MVDVPADGWTVERRVRFDARAALAERALQILLGAGFVGLILIATRLEDVLAPGESVELARARVTAAALHLLIPLAFAAMLTIARVLSRTLAIDARAARAAALVWLTAYLAALAIAGVVTASIVGGLSDISFT